MAQSGCVMAQLGCGMAQSGCGMAQSGCGMAQLVGCQAAVRRPRVRISARHPSGNPLPELAAMKKLERNSANVMNECV
jgi:hypothetical protein